MIRINKIGATVLGLALATIGLTSCNGDQEFDDFEKGTSAYFSMQAPIRTITLGNDDDAVNVDDNNHQFKLQAVMGGVYNNKKDRNLNYTIDPSLMPAGTSMEVLPTSYYQLENANTLTIPSGAVIGGTIVKLTDAFFADPKAATTHYVLPVKIVSSNDVDTILTSKNYQLLCVKYKNEYSGLYCKTGTAKGGTKDVTYKNEDALDVVSTYNLNTSEVTFQFPVQQWQQANDGSWSQGDMVANITLQLSVTGGNVKVLYEGKEVGSGTFTPRGIQDFSDKNRMADCLKINFSLAYKTNAGDAAHEKTWNLSADYVMSMMSRGNKLESWQ